MITCLSNNTEAKKQAELEEERKQAEFEAARKKAEIEVARKPKLKRRQKKTVVKKPGQQNRSHSY